MSWFELTFAELPDPRTGNATQHDLMEVLTIALTASIAGAQNCTEFAAFGVDRKDLFDEFLDLNNGIPSHDTFSRVFRLLDPEAFTECFGRFLEEMNQDSRGIMAIDGKTLRRSFDAAANRSPLEAVTAFSAEGGVVLGQKGFRSGDGDSEITAARALLACLDLRGVLVTADAIHCQDETVRTVLEQGGDYLLALKDNRPALHSEVAKLFEAAEGHGIEPLVTTDKGHGRIEVRRHYVSHDLSWLNGPKTAAGLPELPPGLGCLAMVEAEVTRNGQTTITRRYYLGSAKMTAQRFAEAVRGHWRIENSLHWVLDETFDEDRARNRADNAPENLAVLRKLALNLLRNARRDLSISLKRKRVGWSNQIAYDILGQMR
ncbi:ISAs1 family transposase [Rhodovibrio salinarum]|uniref:ISAs1 family transposase n=1 Tax=Rhodovibrio salinarum TaxID=1087 RepID=UPI000482C851|nr:ISAs1 family transposase [Rhodovibrio salinarum]